MAIYTIRESPAFDDPVMLLALSGWVDAASVGTDAADLVAAEGSTIVEFDRDALFDYRSSRPQLRFEDGDLAEITWPELTISHRVIDGRDVLVMTGNEPDFRWIQLAEETAELVQRMGVGRLVTVGSVPAALPHTIEPRVMTTASVPELLTDDDTVLPGTLVVPGAAVSVLGDRLVQAGVASVGYWAQVPHYLNQPWHAGVLALLQRVRRHLALSLPLDELRNAAEEQNRELDRILAGRPEAQDYVQKLEQMAAEGDGIENLGTPGPLDSEGLPSADELAAEVERYLRGGGSGDDADPP